MIIKDDFADLEQMRLKYLEDKIVDALIEFDKDKEMQWIGMRFEKVLLETLLKAVGKQLNNGWISVKERLPESEDNSVLVQFNNGSIETVHIQDYFDDITAGLDKNGNQLYTKWYISQGVVAWQLLPEEYREIHNE